ncbi:MAG: type III effector HopL1 [Desulfovibrio sp.]|nr:type III effector HopL1 [Desulfovibrio sp.]
MTDAAQNLEATSLAYKDACLEAGQWVARNPVVVRNEEEGLQKELRRAGRLFKRIAQASRRKMCAGVFGPSQAGKSYLISALARDDQGSLSALFGEARHDFILEINPEGGKESTGLVTRFTMSLPVTAPSTHPVVIRLLSETDLVKILANTYFADCEHKEEPQSKIEETLKALEAEAEGSAHSTNLLELDYFEDLREYLYRDFRSKSRVQLLEQTYWERALKIGPKLELALRLKLYALIWDEIPEYTELLALLLENLGKLNFPDYAFAPLEALIPRATSIIDVASLEGLTESKEQNLQLLSLDGRKALLPRAVVTALTAELTIVMEHLPAPYFETMDLLDFPGYRSRYKIDDIRRELKKPGLLKEMFLRGKVAYLFQRYCMERELTSMLLCIGPSNQEVQDLPAVINDWVISTHGATPAKRSEHLASLFLILTKFDLEFEQKKGAPSVESRWDNRLHASLLDFFGKQHDWPRLWDDQGAFRNLFFLRNPNFRFDAVLEYDSEGFELAIRPEMQGYVEELKQAFLHSSLVAAHFAEPLASWEAAMRLNDGGITRIREALRPLQDPKLKLEQLTQSLRDEASQILRRLKVFYRASDTEALLRQKMALVKIFFTRFGALEKHQKRMGLFLRSLTVNDVELYELYPEAQRRYHEQVENEAKKNVKDAPLTLTEVELSEVDIEDWNPFAHSEEEEDSKALAIDKQVDEASFYADYIVSWWLSRLHSLADEPVFQHYFQLNHAEFSALVAELAIGSARLGLASAMAESFRQTSAYVNTKKESIVLEQASMAAHAINAYVTWLGFDPLSKSKAERTIKMGGKEVLIFEPSPEFQGPLQLSEQRTNYMEEYLRDWLYALYALMLGNVNFDGEQEVNVQENNALAVILKKFGQA